MTNSDSSLAIVPATASLDFSAVTYNVLASASKASLTSTLLEESSTEIERCIMIGSDGRMITVL